MGCIRCHLSVDASLATSAAKWLRAFHPDICVAFEEEWVILSSSLREESDLHLVWSIALANEKLLTRGAARRTAVLRELLA